VIKQINVGGSVARECKYIHERRLNIHINN
jgi:hypothetical protein